MDVSSHRWLGADAARYPGEAAAHGVGSWRVLEQRLLQPLCCEAFQRRQRCLPQQWGRGVSYLPGAAVCHLASVL